MHTEIVTTVSRLEDFQTACERAADALEEIGREDKAKELTGAKNIAGEWIVKLWEELAQEQVNARARHKKTDEEPITELYGYKIKEEKE